MLKQFNDYSLSNLKDLFIKSNKLNPLDIKVLENYSKSDFLYKIKKNEKKYLFLIFVDFFILQLTSSINQRISNGSLDIEVTSISLKFNSKNLIDYRLEEEFMYIFEYTLEDLDKSTLSLNNLQLNHFINNLYISTNYHSIEICY